MEKGWRVFEPKKENRHYVLGVDASGGEDGSNPAAICVLEIEDHKQVAQFSERIEPMELYKEVFQAANYYNEAMVAVELEKYGLIVVSELIKTYPNLYFHTIKSTGMKPTHASEFGWNPRYKEEAIHRLQIDYGNGSISIPDKASLVEMVTFVRIKRASAPGKFKMGADKRKFDDNVSSIMIANYVWHEIYDWYIVEDEKDETPREKEDREIRERYDNLPDGTEFWEDEDADKES